MTPYYSHAGITIYLGDNRDVLPTLDAGSVDLVLTDPPYNVGLEYNGRPDLLDRADYIAWCAEWFAMSRRLCSRTIIFPGHGNLAVWWQIRKPSAVGCWYKPGNKGSSIIGWEEWEPWLYWTGNKGLLGGSTVIRAQTGDEPNTGDHPCPKPLELMVKLLLKTKSEAVLDPFLGSGTTLVAAKMLGRRAIGIEIEERYCEIAAKRLQQEILPMNGGDVNPAPAQLTLEPV